MATKLIVVDANDLLELLTHYTEGKVPLGAELLTVGVHEQMTRWLGFRVRSKEWPDKLAAGQEFFNPLHIRYEGKKVMSWGRKGDEVFWQEANEAPRFQG